MNETEMMEFFEAAQFVIGYRRVQNTSTCAYWQAFSAVHADEYREAMTIVEAACARACERDQAAALLATLNSMGW
jgi:hypothetical protein